MSNAQPVPVTESTTMNRDQMIMAWKDLKEQLAIVKEQEMSMRKQLVEADFSPEYDGTQTLELGGGYELKATNKKNYKLSDKESVEKALSNYEDEKLADRLIKWKPELVKKEYKNLSDEDRKIIDIVITTTFGAPTLKLVEPKSDEVLPTLVKN